MPESNAELADRLIRRNATLVGERSTWDAFWEEVGNYVMPRKAWITTKTGSPDTGKDSQLFDSTAIRANQTLANGMLSWMTPHESRWFSYDAPDELAGDDDVCAWFRRCTEIAQAAVARSNFYSEIHEMYLDRGAFGTAAIYVEPGLKTPLLFRSWPVGSFSVAEDSEGYVDTCFREIDMTLRQAEQAFGLENLSEKSRKALEKKGVDGDVKIKILHAIYPRKPEEIDPQRADPSNMPVASVYVEIAERHICKTGGYRENPFAVTRYLKWGDSVYGWCPSWTALPDARQLNFLEKQMDSLAELAAFPRILVPNDHDGDWDLRAGGVTYFDPNKPNAIPKEWTTQGRYDVGLNRAERKAKSIEEAYHVDLFKMFAQLDKQMTAREVAERSAEKLIQFSPTFARMTTELFNPLLQRVFALLIRSGAFPPPPRGAILQDAGGAFLAEPKVSYSSRIALAIKSLENASFMRSMEMIAPLSATRPEILDNYDFDKIVRAAARNDGLPEDWLLDAKSVEEMRAARAQQAAQMQQMQAMQQMADAAGKAARVTPDSMVGQALQGAMEGGQ